MLTAVLAHPGGSYFFDPYFSSSILHRYPDDLHKNLEIQFTVEELEILQKHYLRHIQDISKDNSVKVLSFLFGFYILKVFAPGA